MDENKFNYLVSQTRLETKARRLAMRSLVNLEPTTTIALSEKVSRQLVEQAKKRIITQERIERAIPIEKIHIDAYVSPAVNEVMRSAIHADNPDSVKRRALSKNAMKVLERMLIG